MSTYQLLVAGAHDQSWEVLDYDLKLILVDELQYIFFFIILPLRARYIPWSGSPTPPWRNVSVILGWQQHPATMNHATILNSFLSNSTAIILSVLSVLKSFSFLPIFTIDNNIKLCKPQASVKRMLLFFFSSSVVETG